MYKVLIVDDEPIVKIALRSIINWNDYGYSICATASDGQEALSLVTKLSPNLIITDLKMPVMDGISLIKALKESLFKGEILVISNYDDFEYVRTALVLSAVDYILKVSIEEENLTKHLEIITQRLNNSSVNKVASINGKDSIKQQKMEFQQQIKTYLENSEYTLDLMQENSTLNSDIITAEYAACYINFNNQNCDSKNNISNTLITNSIEEALEDLSEKNIISLPHNTILVLIFMDSLKESISLCSLCQKLLSIFRLYMSISPSIIYQENIKGYETLKECYINFQHITMLEFYEPLDLIHAEEYTPIHYINFIYYKDFVKLLQKNNRNLLDNSMNEVEEIVARCKSLHIYPEILKVFFKRSLELIVYMNHSHSLEIHDYLVDLKESIYTCNSASELVHLVKLFIESVYLPSVTVKRKDLEHIKLETRTAMEYININYNKRISLASIAETVNLSSSYLCRLFKTEWV